MYDYKLITDEYKKHLANNRRSAYNVDDVMSKYNVTEKEAVDIIAERKKKCLGSLSGFIGRYGEAEGKKKYEHFKNVTTSTLENFIRRHGEIEGNKKYKKYMATRDTRSLKAYIKKYGDKANEMREYVSKARDNSSIQHFLKKFDGDLHKATKEYIKCNKKKSFTYQDKIEKYGLEAAKVSKYKSSELFRELCQEYEFEEAIDIYEAHLNKNKIVRLKNRTKFFKAKTNCISKQSLLFFSYLSELYPELDLKHGGNDKELFLKYKDGKINRKYFYDCLERKSNTIIEYHGKAYHPKENDNLDEWFNPFGVSGHDVLAKDKHKKEVAINNGYNSIIVYGSENKSDEKQNALNIGRKISESIKSNKKK